MPRPPKEGSRRNNPDYSPVTAQVPKGLGKRLRLFVTQKETTISEVVEKALAEYLDRNQVQVSVLQPNSIGEVVRQNFWMLREHNIKNIDAIAKGAAPTKADIMRISSILNLDQGELLRLAKDEFGKLLPSNPKEQDANECNSTH